MKEKEQQANAAKSYQSIDTNAKELGNGD